MATVKTSKVLKCEFKNPWTNPKGDTVYYHDIVLDKGDSGSCGTMVKEPDELKVGAEISYTMKGDKIKIDRQNASAPAAKKTAPRKTNSGTNAGKGAGYGNPKHTAFLGYSYAYAKDLVVAGKTSEEDLQNLQHIAQEIYKHIGDLLDGNERDFGDEVPF